jgi:Orsellinic acid/F9775 biosynthesis cluster protein D
VKDDGLMIEDEIEEDASSDVETMNTAVSNITEYIPVCIDTLYNVIICKECSIGLPVEWVTKHLMDNHGIEMSMERIKQELGLEHDAMTVEEAKDWIKNIWVGTAVEGIPVMEGFRCVRCEYSGISMQVMRNHFSKEHKGTKVSEHIQRCKVQLVFKGQLHKYIQIEEPEEMERDEIRDPEWATAVNMEFEKSMANVKAASGKGNVNLRLMNVFIAKMRWDVLVEDMDLEEIVKMTSMPTINRSLHKLILCGRRYIHKTCDELDKGSIIVKRLLMSGGY